MSGLKRGNLYTRTTVNLNDELDVLDTNIHRMSLREAKQFRVPDVMEGRVDLISYIHYKTSNYGWLIMWANDIIDPFTEITSGRLLSIPSLVDYYNFYNNYAKRQS